MSRRATPTPAPADAFAALIDAFADAVAARLADRIPAAPKAPQKAADFLSETTVAELTGLSERTLQGWRCAGRGPAFKRLGRRVVYPADLLRAWIDGGPRSN